MPNEKFNYFVRIYIININDAVSPIADLLRSGAANQQKVAGEEDEAEKEIAVHSAVK